jgi:hypothetical protein
MDMSQVAMCGDYCAECAWSEKMGCRGCQQAKGSVFWGTCRIATCCTEKGFLHCGECPDVPCEVLQEGFDHPEHGDKGERLANLRAWAKGEQTFVKIGTFSEGSE